MDSTEKNNFHARLLDAVGQAVIATDPLGKIVYWNRAAESLYGFSAEEAMGRSIVEVISSEEMVERAEEIMGELGRGKSWTGEFTARRKDGTTFPALVTGTPVHDEQGNLVAIIGVSTDITEVKQTEELRRSEERFRSLVQNSSDVITVIRADGTVIYDSPAVERVLGYKPEERIGTNAFEQAHPNDLERLTRLHGDILASTGGHRTVEIPWHNKDGSLLHAEVTITNLLEDSTVGGVIFNWRDITERKDAEEELKESEERFRLLAENAQDLIYRYRYKPEPGFEYVSPSATTMIGYTPQEHYADPELGHKIVHPDDRHLIKEMLRHPQSPVTIRWLRKDGTIIWTEARNKPIYDEGGELVAVEGISRDVTERKWAEESLGESEQRFKESFENGATGMALVGADGRYLRVNRSLCEIVGYSQRELLGKSYQDITHPDDLEVDLEYHQQLLAGKIRTYQVEKRYLHKEGHVVWALLGTSLVRGEEDKPFYFISQIQDLSERKRMEEQLQHQALHDALTGLPNRKLFMDRLGHALEHTQRTKDRKVAVLFMDLDNFKVVNDSLGHKMGDALLVAVAERLRSSLRPEDTLARFGGDEFAVLVEDVQSPEDVGRMAERVVEDLREPFVVDERKLYVRVSIGIALADAYTNSSEELLRDADTAMYRAKEEAADYRMFDPVMYRRVLARLELEHDLQHALEKEEFTLYYQPKFRLGQPDRIEGVETLLRWERPQRGFMLPGEFVQTAEQTGLIIPIGGWVMKEACRQAKEWQERYPSELPLAMCVNLSPRQVRHPGLLQDVRSALRESGLEAGNLVLEITEGALLNDTEVIETIFKELKALGVRLAIDDFGKDYSSLSYLKRLPVDTLKLDGSFVASLGEDPANTTIVEAVISLAHSLGLEIIGEGVETAEQLELLRGMGCDLVQGHHLARALPSEKVEPMLADRQVY